MCSTADTCRPVSAYGFDLPPIDGDLRSADIGIVYRNVGALYIFDSHLIIREAAASDTCRPVSAFRRYTAAVYGDGTAGIHLIAADTCRSVRPCAHQLSASLFLPPDGQAAVRIHMDAFFCFQHSPVSQDQIYVSFYLDPLFDRGPSFKRIKAVK